MNITGQTRCACGLLALVCALSVATPALAQTPPANSPPAQSTPALVPTPALDSAFEQLFKGTIGDFRRLPSDETLNWLGIGAAAAALGHTQDRHLTGSLSGSRRLGGALEAGQTIGGARLQAGGALATYTIGRLTRSPRVSALGADLFRAQVLAQVMTGVVKLSVRRTRPDGTEFSFPSGHTSVTFASATVLQRHLGWKVGVPAYAVASYVATSRIQAKRHFLSDVAFGAALGVIAGRTITIGDSHARFAVAPVAIPGGGGISFSWMPKH
jgi:membrane-associated phospholipid phosphatase